MLGSLVVFDTRILPMYKNCKMDGAIRAGGHILASSSLMKFKFNPFLYSFIGFSRSLN